MDELLNFYGYSSDSVGAAIPMAWGIESACVCVHMSSARVIGKIYVKIN